MGRKKIKDEIIDIPKARDLLGRLNEDQEINGRYIHNGHVSRFLGTTPAKTLRTLSQHFSQSSPIYYVDVRHQVYNGTDIQVHYLDIYGGYYTYSRGNVHVKSNPNEEMNLEYVVQTK